MYDSRKNSDKRPQAFNDGIAIFYGLENTALPGNMPKMELVEKYKMRFQELNVGYNRYFTAKQNKIVIDRFIRCLSMEIESEFVVGVGNDQYKIRQKQQPLHIKPKVMDLTLEKIDEQYVIGGG